ncbi:MAG: hypothetical protein MJ078_06310, partial [Clostridia bacterium]|nr:hypothetical protein [Clostridia bacterium]
QGWLKAVAPLDVYEDEAGNRSVTFRFTFSSKEKTLSKAELSPVTDGIIAAYTQKGLRFKEG